MNSKVELNRRVTLISREKTIQTGHPETLVPQLERFSRFQTVMIATFSQY